MAELRQRHRTSTGCAVLALGWMALAGADTNSLLKLPSHYVSAKWSKFVEERKSHDESLIAMVKAPKRDGKSKEKMGPAVVKVLARTRLPVRALVDTFQSKDEEVLAEWNKFAGDVTHIKDNVQLQTYRLPWPFMPRDYLVRCTDRVDKAGHTAHCASLESDHLAPEREGAVRGKSETIWRFRAEPDGATSIHLETLVDPRGMLPAWLIDKAGKLASVGVVRGLVKATSSRFGKASSAEATASDGWSSMWASVTGLMRRLVYG